MTVRLRCMAFFATIFSVIISAHGQSSRDDTSSQRLGSKVVERILAFPSPVEWRLRPDNRSVGISLTGIAWGPSAASEMISKATEAAFVGKAEQFPGRSYAIALHFQARMAEPLLDMRTRSGLVRIKDADGNMDPPWDLTSAGFARKDYDIHFKIGETVSQYWDFFAVPADKKEFLFEIHSPSESVSYFRVLVKDNDLIVVNSTPQPSSACLQFEKTFGGSIGAHSVVSLQIKRDNVILSGTEQYARIGKTLWLAGAVDSLGYFTIEERYPKDIVTGILKGRFDANYQAMSGYFSKPDGSRLQPFEFHAGSAGIQPPPQSNCEFDN